MRIRLLVAVAVVIATCSIGGRADSANFTTFVTSANIASAEGGNTSTIAFNYNGKEIYRVDVLQQSAVFNEPHRRRRHKIWKPPRHRYLGWRTALWLGGRAGVSGAAFHGFVFRLTEFPTAGNRNSPSRRSSAGSAQNAPSAMMRCATASAAFHLALRLSSGRTGADADRRQPHTEAQQNLRCRARMP